MKDIGIIDPLAEESIIDINKNEIQSHEMNHKRFMKTKRGLLMLLITFTLITGTICFYIYKSNKEEIKSVELDRFQVTLDEDTEFINIEGFLTVGGIKAQLIERLFVNDTRLTSFDTSPFPNLKNLYIDENLKLDTLIVNKSNIVEFSYNSTEILNLWMINNKKMTSFINSNLPSLKNLTVVSTSIKTWKSITLGKLETLIFVDSNIGEIPILDQHLFNLKVNKGTNITFQQNFFNKLSLLQNIELVSIYLTSSLDLSFDNTPIKDITLKDINLHNMIIKECSQLRSITLDLDKVNIIDIDTRNNVNPCSYSLKANSINQMFFNDDYLQEFFITVKNLNNLSIGGKNIQKIPYKIPGLQILTIQNTQINSSQFAKIQINTITQLYLIQNTNIDQLINTFSNLRILSMKNQNSNVSKLVALQIRVMIFSLIQSENFSTQGNFPNLNEIQIINSKISTLNIITPNKVLTLINSTSLSNTNIQIIFQQKQIQFLQVKGSFVTIQNQTFPNLCYIQLQNTTFTLFQNRLNCIRQDFYFHILTETTLKLVNNTILAFGQFIFKNDFRLMNFSQNLSNIRKVECNDNNMNSVQFIFKSFTRLQTFSSNNNAIPYIHFFNGQLTRITIKKAESNFSMYANKFPYLIQLNIESNHYNPLASNYFPRLESLSIQNFKTDNNMSFLLEEFNYWQGNGTNLKYLYLPNISDSQEAQIRAIFPNITFI